MNSGATRNGIRKQYPSSKYQMKYERKELCSSIFVNRQEHAVWIHFTLEKVLLIIIKECGLPGASVKYTL